VSLQLLARPATLLPSETPMDIGLQAAAHRDVLVTQVDGAVHGLLDVSVARALAARDSHAPVALAVSRFPPDAIVLPGDDPAQVAQRARAGGFVAMLLIDDDGRPAGVLRCEDIFAALTRRSYRKGRA
jgi:hypothetical protein